VAELEPKENMPAGTPEIIETERWRIPPNRPRKVYAGMWGPLEIGAASVALLAVLMAAVAYFFWVLPSSRELARNKSEADRLEAELISAKSKYGEIASTETQVGKLVASIDDFETRFLPVTSTGQAALYQRLNGLISAYGLTNTTGPDYAPLEAAVTKPGQETEEERGRSKFRSLYPGVYVSTTLEGSYQNLRRFIREIETGREFIIVSAVELAPTDTEKQKDTTTAGANQPANAIPMGGAGVNPGVRTMQPEFGQTSGRAKATGKMHGETVSLHIEMAAYFRRPNYAPAQQQH
jgi:hypothetical protein